MANLYNVLTDASQERFPTFRAIVDYASRTNQLDLLTPYLDSLHEMRTWHVTDEQRVDVYLLAADSLDAASKKWARRGAPHSAPLADSPRAHAVRRRRQCW